MHLAFLGRIDGHDGAALELVRLCFESLGLGRVIYVGGDDALHRIATRYLRTASTPKADPASAESFWRRSLRCVSAQPPAIHQFVIQERRLASWLRVERAGEAETSPEGEVVAEHRRISVRVRLTEAPDDRVRAPGNLVVLGGKCPPSLPQATTPPWRIAPGTLGEAGLVILRSEDAGTEVVNVEMLNRRGQRQRHCRLHLPN